MANGMNDCTEVRLNGSSAHSRAGAPRAELLESLSAMMDDEAQALEVRRIVKAVGETQELSAHWRRYHAVRASLQQDVHQRPSIDLLPGIHAALAGQQHGITTPAGSIAARQMTGRLAKLAGQMAIAASVAAAVLVGYPVLVANNGDATASLVATSTTAEFVPVTAPSTESIPTLNGDFSPSALARTVSLDEAARDRLEKAVRNFSGNSAVIDASTTPMFKNQLQPFSGTPASASATPGQSR